MAQPRGDPPDEVNDPISGIEKALGLNDGQLHVEGRRLIKSLFLRMHTNNGDILEHLVVLFNDRIVIGEPSPPEKNNMDRFTIVHDYPLRSISVQNGPEMIFVDSGEGHSFMLEGEAEPISAFNEEIAKAKSQLRTPILKVLPIRPPKEVQQHREPYDEAHHGDVPYIISEPDENRNESELADSERTDVEDGEQRLQQRQKKRKRLPRLTIAPIKQNNEQIVEDTPAYIVAEDEMVKITPVTRNNKLDRVREGDEIRVLIRQLFMERAYEVCMVHKLQYCGTVYFLDGESTKALYRYAVLARIFTIQKTTCRRAGTFEAFFLSEVEVTIEGPRHIALRWPHRSFLAEFEEEDTKEWYDRFMEAIALSKTAENGPGGEQPIILSNGVMKHGQACHVYPREQPIVARDEDPDMVNLQMTYGVGTDFLLTRRRKLIHQGKLMMYNEYGRLTDRHVALLSDLIVISKATSHATTTEHIRDIINLIELWNCTIETVMSDVLLHIRTPTNRFFLIAKNAHTLAEWEGELSEAQLALRDACRQLTTHPHVQENTNLERPSRDFTVRNPTAVVDENHIYRDEANNRIRIRRESAQQNAQIISPPLVERFALFSKQPPIPSRNKDDDEFNAPSPMNQRLEDFDDSSEESLDDDEDEESKASDDGQRPIRMRERGCEDTPDTGEEGIQHDVVVIGSDEEDEEGDDFESGIREATPTMNDLFDDDDGSRAGGWSRRGTRQITPMATDSEHDEEDEEEDEESGESRSRDVEIIETDDDKTQEMRDVPFVFGTITPSHTTPKRHGVDLAQLHMLAAAGGDPVRLGIVAIDSTVRKARENQLPNSADVQKMNGSKNHNEAEFAESHNNVNGEQDNMSATGGEEGKIEGELEEMLGDEKVLMRDIDDEEERNLLGDYPGEPQQPTPDQSKIVMENGRTKSESNGVHDEVDENSKEDPEKDEEKESAFNESECGRDEMSLSKEPSLTPESDKAGNEPSSPDSGKASDESINMHDEIDILNRKRCAIGENAEEPVLKSSRVDAVDNQHHSDD